MSDDKDNKRPDDELNQGAQEVVRILRWFFGALTVLMLAAIVYYFLSGIFILESGKHAAVYRFGRLVDPIKEQPDWYWILPKHIDSRKEVRVSKPITITSAYFWYKEDPRSALDGGGSEKEPERSLRVGEDGYHVTADNNVMHSKWSLGYVVSDLKAYLTQCTDVEFLIRTILRNAVVRASGQKRIDEIFGGDPPKASTDEVDTEEDTPKPTKDFVELVRERVIRDVAAMKVGVTIVKVNLDAKAVPQAAKSAFEEKTNAANEKDKYRKDALGYEERQKKLGEAKASRLTQEAEAYKKTIQDSVVADAKYMKDLLPEYRKHGPSILLREYSDVLLKVIEGATQIAVVSPNQEIRIRIEPRLEPQVKKEKNGKEH